MRSALADLTEAVLKPSMNPFRLFNTILSHHLVVKEGRQLRKQTREKSGKKDISTSRTPQAADLFLFLIPDLLQSLESTSFEIACGECQAKSLIEERKR